MGIFSPSEKVKKKNDVTGDESSVEESDLNLYLTQEEITVSNDCNTYYNHVFLLIQLHYKLLRINR